MYGVEVNWSAKVKYVGCYFNEITCHIDINDRIQKYNGASINNIFCQYWAKVNTN